MAPKNESDIGSPVSKLTIDPEKSNPLLESVGTPQQQKPKPGRKKKQEIVDSWEDEDVSSNDGTPTSPAPSESPAMGPAAPLPTPMALNYHSSATQAPYGGNFPSSPFAASWSTSDSSTARGTLSRRPEKTDAVARRLIAGALGIRTPKQTDEQKAYEKSLRDTERKRREDERATQKRQQEETEKAKKAIWDD